LLLGVLLHGLALVAQICQGLVVIELELGVAVVEVGQLFVLQLGLLAQAQVLQHDVALNLADVLFRLLHCVFSKVI